MAPASVNGVATTGWPWRAISIRPSPIGPSRRSGELVLMTVIRDGSREEVVAGHAAGEARDVERVLDRARAEAEALPGLVELDREGPVHVEVAGLDRQVVRFERAAALLVDDVERADDPDVVDEVGVVAGAPAAVEVGDEGRPADGPEDEVRATEPDGPLGGRGRGGRIRSGRSR